MARQLKNYSNAKVRGTVRILGKKSFTSTEKHREISSAYRLRAVSRPVIVKWYQRFEDSRTYLNDAERQGRPTMVNTSDIVDIDFQSEFRSAIPKKI